MIELINRMTQLIDQIAEFGENYSFLIAIPITALIIAAILVVLGKKF